MTDQQHPIIPTPDTIDRLLDSIDDDAASWTQELAIKAAQWGADQQLEACHDWLIDNQNPRWAVALRAGCRPKPPSLAEEALKEFQVMKAATRCADFDSDFTAIRRALERLQELEGAG